MKKLKSKEAAELRQATIELLREWKPHLKTNTISLSYDLFGRLI